MSYCIPYLQNQRVKRMDEKVTVRIPDGQREKIERVIKREYPKMKTISDVVRNALSQFLDKEV
jgi:Arc/MetJ-type ribon-helix-helix transcriptional regulator